MRDLHEYADWYAEVQNFGWRSQSGHQIFRAENGVELLRAVLPKTDCTYKVYFRGDHVAINNAHHDSPTWNEWYTIYPAFACEGWCERVYKRDDLIETDDGLFCSACKKRIDDAPETDSWQAAARPIETPRVKGRYLPGVHLAMRRHVR